MSRGVVLAFLAWGALLAVGWLIYYPGLQGSFIFDDAPNLNALSRISDGSFHELLSFALQGFAGPSGRPASLLTFALQYPSWPDAPADFKRVNVLIHLLNACLVYWLVLVIERARGTSDRLRLLMPLVASGLWLLWPIQVSSVLYVVQRMTLLSATCMLAGLIVYVYARLAADAPSRSPRWLSHAGLVAAIGIGAGLGILFKENAIVFPLLALSLSATLMRSLTPQPRLWTIALWMPIAALLAYLLAYSNVLNGFQTRDFSLVERLMTQGRVLWLYVFQIVTPSTGSLRFLYDNYPVSTSLLTPISTLPSLAAWGAVTVVAWRLRKRSPIFAFAVLFFLASHALESTFLPLELVFEHRNYLGSLGLAYGLAGLVLYLFDRDGRKIRTIGLSSAYLLLIAWTTLSLTTLWGQPLLQKQFWLMQNPDSPRVHLDLAGTLLIEGHGAAAAQRLDEASGKFPEDPSFAVARVELACYYPELKPSSLELVETRLRAGSRGQLATLVYLDRLVVALTREHCTTYPLVDALKLLEAVQANKAFEHLKTEFLVLEGVLHSHAGDVEAARAILNSRLAMGGNSPTLLIQAAAWELGNGALDEADLHLQSLHVLERTSPLKLLPVLEDLKKLQAQRAQLEEIHRSP